MEEIYRGFYILEEHPNEENLSEFTVFVWKKDDYYKSELYENDCLGGYIGFGETQYRAVKSAVDEYWKDN